MNVQAILAGMALLILGVLGFALVCHAVPTDNRELLSMIIGAIAGGLVVGGGQKLADKITAPNGMTANVSADPTPPTP